MFRLPTSEQFPLGEYLHHHDHQHWQNGPFRAIAFPRNSARLICSQLCRRELDIQFLLSGVSVLNLFTEQGRKACVQSQPVGPDPFIHVPQSNDGPVIPPGSRLFFLRLLWLAGLQRSYSNQPPHKCTIWLLCTALIWIHITHSINYTHVCRTTWRWSLEDRKMK
jgi:hypothetical protein